MIDPTTKAGARAAERLERELILWLTTVTAEGQPQAPAVQPLGPVLLRSRANPSRSRMPRAGQPWS
jgi:hypothetical protein